MRVILVLFAILAICAAKVMAQDGGFFIPQQTIEMMNRTEQLPPVESWQYEPDADTVDLGTEDAAKPTVPTKAQPKTRPIATKNYNGQVATKNYGTPSAPKQQANKPAANTETAQRRPIRAQKPMVPQTGTPAIPVYADNPDKPSNINKPQATPSFKEPPLPNTDNIKALATNEDIASEESPLTYDRIIAEYNRDILKISKNLPAENKRLQEVLEKYHDETITF